MEMFFAKSPYNYEALAIELHSAYPLSGLTDGNGGVRVTMPDGTSQATWDGIGVIIALHDATLLTESQKVDSARETVQSAAKDYILRQLLSPSPVGTIYTTMKTYIDGNVRLLAMMTTLQTLANLAFGWTPASLNNPANNNDRGRYLILALLLVAVLH